MDETKFYYIDDQGSGNRSAGLGDLMKARHLPPEMPIKYKVPGRAPVNTTIGNVWKENSATTSSSRESVRFRSIRRQSGGGLALLSKPPAKAKLVRDERFKLFTLESLLRNVQKTYVDSYVLHEPIEKCELCEVSFNKQDLAFVFTHVYSKEHLAKLRSVGVAEEDYHNWLDFIGDVCRKGIKTESTGSGLESASLQYENRFLPMFSTQSSVPLEDAKSVENGIQSLKRHFESLDQSSRDYLHTHCLRQGINMKFCLSCNVHCTNGIEIIEHMLGDGHLTKMKGRISLRDVYFWNRYLAVASQHDRRQPSAAERNLVTKFPPLLFHPSVIQSLNGMTASRRPLDAQQTVDEIQKLQRRLGADLEVFWDGDLSINCHFCFSNGVIVHLDTFLTALYHLFSSQQHLSFMTGLCTKEDFSPWHKTIDRITCFVNERRELAKLLDPEENIGQVLNQEREKTLILVTQQIKSLFYHANWQKITARFAPLTIVLGDCKYCGLASFENMALVLQHVVSDEHIAKVSGKVHGYSQKTADVIETMLMS